MARYWLRGLWIGVLIGLVLGLIPFSIQLFEIKKLYLFAHFILKLNPVYWIVYAGEETCHMGSGLVAMITLPILFPIIFAMIGALIGLAFKKKRRRN